LDKNATERNIWVDQMNDLVRSMARQEGVPIAEIHGDFLAQPSLRDLFFDHVHPNDSGYQIMARSWFDAITSSSSPAASGRMRTSGMAFGFDPPGGP
jgi:lysophospholipase L1-like esterase